MHSAPYLHTIAFQTWKLASKVRCMSRKKRIVANPDIVENTGFSHESSFLIWF
jgi:hypothetical protein